MVAGGDRDRRVAVQVGGERQPAVVAGAGLDRRRTPRQRAVGVERDVGVAGGDDEVDAVDRDRRSRAIASFSSIRRLSILARASSCSGPGRISIAQRISGVSTSAQPGHTSPSSASIGDHAADAPRRAHRWAAWCRRVDAPQTGVGRSGASAASASTSHIAGDTAAPPQSGTTATRAPRRPSANDAEPGLPSVDPRQAEHVAAVVAVAHVEPARRVAHAARHAPDGDGVVADSAPWRPGDAAERRLQPEQAGEARRDADRTAAVAAGRDA